MCFTAQVMFYALQTTDFNALLPVIYWCKAGFTNIVTDFCSNSLLAEGYSISGTLIISIPMHMWVSSVYKIDSNKWNQAIDFYNDDIIVMIVEDDDDYDDDNA